MVLLWPQSTYLLHRTVYFSLLEQQTYKFEVQLYCWHKNKIYHTYNQLPPQNEYYVPNIGYSQIVKISKWPVEFNNLEYETDTHPN